MNNFNMWCEKNEISEDMKEKYVQWLSINAKELKVIVVGANNVFNMPIEAYNPLNSAKFIVNMLDDLKSI